MDDSRTGRHIVGASAHAICGQKQGTLCLQAFVGTWNAKSDDLWLWMSRFIVGRQNEPTAGKLSKSPQQACGVPAYGYPTLLARGSIYFACDT